MQLLNSSALVLILFIHCCTFSDCYDPLDPNGKITVTFDIFDWTDEGYKAKVTIRNLYQYRHIDKPGWSIGWTWTKNEIIWSMAGAFATIQGDCSNFLHTKPHSCLQKPVIVDFGADAAPVNKSEDCCHGGLLSAYAIDPSNSLSSFEMTVGNLNLNRAVPPPANLTLLAPGPGYTCSPVLQADPTQFSDIGGKRTVQVYRTWKSTCTYSSFLANKRPVCCVSLSTFYNPEVTTCPECSCGCKETNQKVGPCIREGSSSSSVELLQCTNHMCPVRVHWHIKNNYMSQWRVKLTISNYNYQRSYSNWNVLVQHPGFSQKTTSYSFNSIVLPTVGFTDKVALFWGILHYNSELLQANAQVGSVSTEMLMEKDLSSFTLGNGWGLPRRIYFGGEECEMPLPDSFPMLPNASSTIKLHNYSFHLFLAYLISKTLITWLR